ncbi:hypothetical protein O6P43_000654 [Quillaja saponaria]|uniref:Uncharacterized protein n=1 Tax=Quillaja saponaria TaxID=32244 RepID=A0AAD7VMR8_QUISA|nr:hypothetical protein O6P43_000654 [Quillaja saponaria]
MMCVGGDEKRKLKQAEGDEKVMHLICWGPRTCARAIDGFKDHISKGVTKPSQPRSDSDNSAQFRRFSRAAEPMKMVDVGRNQNIRKAEKAENVMHLICWGPK